MCVQILISRQPKRKSPTTARQKPYDNMKSDFSKAVSYHADKNHVIYLALVDSAYIPMALNLYETSFKKLDIKNYLFVCSDASAHWTLHNRGLHSMDYFHHNDAMTPSDYGTKAFKLKTHLKTKMILDALLLGVTVIIIDVDIVLLKDPLPFFDNISDIQIQDNVVDLNSGFYMARPTQASVRLHQKAWETAGKKGHLLSNQLILSPLMMHWSQEKKLRLRKLPNSLFPCGKVYFEYHHRMFHSDNPPDREVLVHNNWIFSEAAKIYRFKEHLLWAVDTDGYFSYPSRKYLTYKNAIHTSQSDLFLEDEIEALQTALLVGHLLNRTVILPSFSCKQCTNAACKVASRECSFNTHYKIDTFDSFYRSAYREHAFLNHPLVPDSLKTDSTTYLILPTTRKPKEEIPGHVTVMKPKDRRGPTEEEIVGWFSSATEPVLRFHSLNNIYGNFKDTSYIKTGAFDRSTNYRQEPLKMHSL